MDKQLFKRYYSYKNHFQKPLKSPALSSIFRKYESIQILLFVWNDSPYGLYYKVQQLYTVNDLLWEWIWNPSMSVDEDVIVAFSWIYHRQTHWSSPDHLHSLWQIMNVLKMLLKKTRKNYNKENAFFLNYCKAISENLEKITQPFQCVKDKVILPSLMTLTQMQFSTKQSGKKGLFERKL